MRVLKARQVLLRKTKQAGDNSVPWTQQGLVLLNLNQELGETSQGQMFSPGADVLRYILSISLDF